LHEVVTTHARLRGRDHRAGGPLDLRLAVATVPAHLTCVQTVGVGDGLLRRVADLEVLRREVIPRDADRADEREETTDSAVERQLVQSSGEDLHWLVRRSCALRARSKLPDAVLERARKTLVRAGLIGDEGFAAQECFALANVREKSRKRFALRSRGARALRFLRGATSETS